MAIEEAVELKIPPSARWIRLARLVATGVANSAGFGADGLEDARVAIDEACGLLVEREPTSAIDISFRIVGSAIDVRACCAAGGDGAIPDGLAADVLGAVTRSWEWLPGEGMIGVHFVVDDSVPPG